MTVAPAPAADPSPAHALQASPEGSPGGALEELAARLAERMAGLDLHARIGLVESLVPGRLVFTTSLGIEDQAVTHALATLGGRGGARKDRRTQIVTLDTGRLFAETYDVWAETESAYGLRIRAYAPERGSLERFVAEQGINAFRQSIEARRACCGLRKVEPLERALAGASGWITGLRAGQSANRSDTPLAQADHERGLLKINPLADWDRARVERFVRDNFVPYNALHDRGFPSIGCAPCTRAVRVGEDERAGRWWWEQDAKRECGLHLHAPAADSPGDAITEAGAEPAAFERPTRAPDGLRNDGERIR